MTDFFVSYNSADTAWAEWVAYVLEEERFSVLIQAWDFRPGSNFALEMQNAAASADRTVMVLSPAYLKSPFAAPEWAAAFAQDPEGLKRKLIPVRVRTCQPEGLLASVVFIDLVNLGEVAARQTLMDGIKNKRGKPARRPTFPGAPSDAVPAATFPGAAPTTTAVAKPYQPKIHGTPTDADKRRFIRQTFSTMKTHFERGLQSLSQSHDNIETEFQPVTTNEFIAEIFVAGKSRCRCHIWMGSGMGTDNISYFEGQGHFNHRTTNEMLALENQKGELKFAALMSSGSGRLVEGMDLKRMSSEQVAEYLWRRFVSPLERQA